LMGDEWGEWQGIEAHHRDTESTEEAQRVEQSSSRELDLAFFSVPPP